LPRKESVRLGLPHRRPSGRPPRTTDATFARRLGRGVIGYLMPCAMKIYMRLAFSIRKRLPY